VKNYILSLTFICALFTISYSQASVMNIDVLSRSHHIYGAAGQNDPNYVYNTFDINSNSPVHYRVDGTSTDYSGFYGFDPNAAEAWAGDFSVRTLALRWESAVIAESIYTFQPKNNSLVIDVEASDSSHHQYQDLWLSITNLNTGENLLYDAYNLDHPNNQYHHDDWVTYITDQYLLSVDSKSTYELHMYATGWGGDDMAGTYVNVAMAAVPEPTSIALMIMGLVGLGMTSRKSRSLRILTARPGSGRW
jgi:hypothetical protein